ncbi:hypothetical protein V6N13_057364 [Hibiscus sabdariffa]
MGFALVGIAEERRFVVKIFSEVLEHYIHRRTPGADRVKRETINGGRDESKRQRAESQWIVAARPLCHLQYPVAYLSRLQRILPAARWKLRCRAARTTSPTRVLRPRHVPLGAIGPYCGSAIGQRAHASLLARILT